LAVKIPEEVRQEHNMPNSHVIIFSHLMGHVSHVRVYTDWKGGMERLNKMRKVGTPTHKFKRTNWQGEENKLTVSAFADWAYNYERKEFKAPGKGESSRECHRYVTFVINDFANAGDDKFYRVCPGMCDKPVCCTPDKFSPTKTNGKGNWITPQTIGDYKNPVTEDPVDKDAEKDARDAAAKAQAAQEEQERQEALKAKMEAIEKEKKELEEKKAALAEKAARAAEEAARRQAEQERLEEEEKIFFYYVYAAIAVVLALSGVLVYYLQGSASEPKSSGTEAGEKDIESQECISVAESQTPGAAVTVSSEESDSNIPL